MAMIKILDQKGVIASRGYVCPGCYVIQISNESVLCNSDCEVGAGFENNDFVLGGKSEW